LGLHRRAFYGGKLIPAQKPVVDHELDVFYGLVFVGYEKRKIRGSPRRSRSQKKFRAPIRVKEVIQHFVLFQPGFFDKTFVPPYIGD
jgi:hypothetical protein